MKTYLSRVIGALLELSTIDGHWDWRGNSEEERREEGEEAQNWGVHYERKEMRMRSDIGGGGAVDGWRLVGAVDGEKLE